MKASITISLLLLAILAPLLIHGQSSSTGTSLPSKCGDGTTANTCPTGYSCINKQCSYTPCVTCSSGDQCVFGSCIGIQVAPPCTPECESPSICSLTLQGDSGICQSPSDLCGSCNSDQVCVFGTCQTCPSCANSTWAGIAATTVWGSNVQVTISAATSGIIADGQWATFTSANTVVMGVKNGVIDQSGLLIQAGTSASVSGSITGVGNKTGIVIQAGSSLTAGSIVVPSGLTTTVAFESLTTSSVTPNNAWLSLSSVSVTGDLVLAGGGKVAFPSQPSSVTLGAGGMLTVAGNVTITGTTGTLPIYVGYVAAQSGDVRFNTTTASGNIYGSSTDTIFVTGSFVYSGAYIQPILDVSNQGVARITSLSLKAGAVQLNHGGQLIITNPSASVSFSEFTSCDSKSYIVVIVPSVLSMAGGTYTAARFDSVSASQGDVACWVKLLDSTGAYALLPHVYTPYIDPEDGGRRRLLSMKTQTDDEIREAYRYHARFSTNGYSVATNGNSTFDYNSNLITYTYTREVSYTYLSAATNTVPAMVAIVAMIASIIGTRMFA